MIKEKITITDRVGLHLRPAGELCKEACKYKSKIELTCKNTTVNAKSVISVLSACVKFNDEIEITCDGEDEEEALKNVIAVLSGREENSEL